MAANLIDAGHELTVWNRTAERSGPLADKGAIVAESPRAAAERAEIVMSMLRDDAASRQTWCDPQSGALAGMNEGGLAIESSTLTVGWIKDLAGRCAAGGVRFADAPVSGSLPQAEAAKLVYLVGADDEAFAAARPFLEAMGTPVHHCGPIGAGTAIKLAINMLLGVQVAAMAEALGVVEHAGLDTARSAEIIGSTAVTSPAMKVAADMMLKGKFPRLFPVGLMDKDLGNIANAAAETESWIPLSTAARAVYQQAIDQGLEEETFQSVFKLFRD